MTAPAPSLSVAQHAERLAEAARQGEPVDQLAVEPTVQQAYAVQARMLADRVAGGDRLVGVKLGFTSRAKMEQMGVDSVIAGFLLNAQQIPADGVLDRSRLIHPRVEPEVAFRLARDVAADEPVDALLAAVDAVAPALEVIDSRYRDFQFRLGDVIADNTSAARFMVGQWLPVRGGIADLGVELKVDGATVTSGSTAAILGDPWEALRALRDLPDVGHLALRAGGVVLAGAATEAVPLPESGRVEVEIATLGRAGFGVRSGS